MRQHLYKLAMIVLLGTGFALAQSMPQQPSSSGSSSPSTQQPSSTDQQQPSAAPDQGQKPANAPETLPNTDQKKSDDQGAKKDQDQKLPQSDAAPAATGDVQNTIQSAIQKDATLANANITVEVKNGKAVELTGTVPNKEAKESAERIAKENSGGLKVKNHLKVASNDHDKDQNAKPDMNNPKK